MTERELEEGKKRKKKAPHKQNQTLERKMEGINLCKSDTALEKMPGLTILIMVNCTLPSHFKRSKG